MVVRSSDALRRERREGRTWRARLGRWTQDDRVMACAVALVLFIVYAVTAQAHINGSRSPYATDVGEIQNALPRWGTLHFTGYPQYSLLGSALVSLLRLVGVAPALGASLYSAVWGAALGALTYLVARELGATRTGGLVAALASGLALSFWMDAAIAEVHTMTLALTAGTMLAAVRFKRTGMPAALLWMAGLFAQGVVHQRAVAFMAPALLVLVWGRWRIIWRHATQIILLALAALATYLYLPLRAWMGADWTFNAPGTWRGFWTLVLDTKSERIVRFPASWAELLDRAVNIVTLLRQDVPLLLLGLGLVGLVVLAWRKCRAEALALALVVAVHAALAGIIWEGRISDALLAVKLPVVWACALGLAVLMPAISRRWWALLPLAATLALALFFGWRHAPQVLAVTRDRSSEPVVQRVSQLAAMPETVVWMPWGHDYWALQYAQRYRGELVGLTLVDHNAPLVDILASGRHLVTPQETFYVFAPDWWRERLGGLALSAVGDGLVEVLPGPVLAGGGLADPIGELGQGVAAASASVSWVGAGALDVRVTWLATAPLVQDYAVAAHLIGWPAGSEALSLVSQADAQHPVYGWYPTSSWTAGELVADAYLIPVPPGARPQELRLFMYTQDDAGFHNSAAVIVPVSPIPDDD